MRYFSQLYLFFLKKQPKRKVAHVRREVLLFPARGMILIRKETAMSSLLRSAVLLTAILIAAFSPLALAQETGGDAPPATPKTPLKVVYGFDQEFPPYSFTQAGGEASGFEVDLIMAIFKGQNAQLQLKPLSWDRIQLELAGGQITLTTGMVKTKQRAELYAFSALPTISANLRFFTKTPNRVADPSLLRGQTVAVEKGSYAQRLLDMFGGIIVKPYPTKQEALNALFTDQVIAYCGPEGNTYFLLDKFQYTGITALGTPLRLSDMYIAVNKDLAPAVMPIINAGMRLLVQTGEYERIFRRWFVQELTPQEIENMKTAAVKASVSAYAPYTHLGMGAALLSKTGRIYTGCTVENALLSFNVSALRNALGAAVLAGDTELRGAIIVDAKSGQVLTASAEDIQCIYEFNRGTLFVQEQNPDKSWATKTAGELLPNPTRLQPVEEVDE